MVYALVVDEVGKGGAYLLLQHPRDVGAVRVQQICHVGNLQVGLQVKLVAANGVGQLQL